MDAGARSRPRRRAPPASGSELVPAPAGVGTVGRARSARGRRRRVGSQRAHARDRAPALRPDLPPLVPRRVGGARAHPTRGWRAARRQPRRRHPLRRAGDHARARDGARHDPSTASPTTSSARCPSSARSGRGPAACPRTPTTRSGCSTTSSSSCSCSPRARRRPASSSRERYRLRRFGRGGFVEIAMRAGVPDRADRDRRQRGGDADPRQERSSSRSCSTSRTCR